MQSLTKKIIIFLVFALPSFAVQAEGYHVELVIFANLRQVTDGEVSQTVMAYPDYSNSLEPGGGNEAGNPFRLLSSGFYKLDAVYNQLKTSGMYRPLVHMAWQQPALQGDNARSVHILKTDPGDAEHAGATLVKIDGTVRVRASQFLHVDVDLLYFVDALPQSDIHPAGDTAVTGTPQFKYARMREMRRMKLNELHYFDHPLFGMIMHISRAGAQ